MMKKILIIEDDRSFLKLAKYVLERAGYSVLTAENGFAGLDRAMAEAPALVILDVMLPGIDGLDICRWLNANAATAAIPVVAVSAKVRQQNRADICASGACCYMEKPLQPEMMLEIVEELLTVDDTPGGSYSFSGLSMEYAC